MDYQILSIKLITKYSLSSIRFMNQVPQFDLLINQLKIAHILQLERKYKLQLLRKQLKTTKKTIKIHIL